MDNAGNGRRERHANRPDYQPFGPCVVNLCEVKFVNTEFEVKNDYEMTLRERLNWMVAHVSHRHNVQMTLVTTYGLKHGVHSGIFQRVITLDSLFESG